ncbi:hypothetical protein C8F04DRAFT_1186605 [Mycena alexandri]|uniref:Uncharacterized protein n=1 Tax=Mycena alexandri TaxID=1745969 RepID=A0AAD6SMF6_9AGAR|nr:hypothetical protein C8F04DRAFT_1186605 [Mycena alexandri]
MGKKRKRIAKEDRQNLRLWAEGGARDALERGWLAERDYLQQICNEYHARIDWRLKDHEEPESIPDYDPAAPLPVETLDDDEKKRKRKQIALLNKVGDCCGFVDGSSTRARRLRKQVRPSSADAHKNPWTILVNQLAGLKIPPKARQAYQQYMREKYEQEIAPVVAERWLQQSSEGSNVQTSKKPTAAFRAEVARDLFAGLPENERNGYKERAKEEADAARAAYNKAMKEPPSRTPEARQKCIDEVGNFLGPIQKGILEHTGLHSVVLLGGPIPKYGQLNTIYCSYGHSRAAGKQHFPEWAGERWDVHVTDLMTEYLQSAFNKGKQKATLPAAAKGKKQAARLTAGASTSATAFTSTATASTSTATASTSTATASTARREPPASHAADGRDHRKNANREGLRGLFPPKKAAAPVKRKRAVETNAGGESAEGPRKSRRLNPGAATPHAPAEGDNNDDDEEPAAPGDDDDEEAAPGDDHDEDAPASPFPPPTRVPTPEGGDTHPPRAPTPTPTATPLHDATAALSTRVPTPDPEGGDTHPRAPTPAATPPRDAAADKPRKGRGKGKGKGQVKQDKPGGDRTHPVGVISIVMSQDAPAWLAGCVKLLSMKDLGCHFTALLATLVKLETKFGFETAPSEPLPAETVQNQGRDRTKKIPPIANVAKYAKQWQAWWNLLQPASRRRDHDGNLMTGGEARYGASDAWGVLDVQGPNGWLSVVASLYFWGVCDQTDELKATWEYAVQDVMWMMEGLIASF